MNINQYIKRYFLITGATLLLFSLSSCVEYLDKKPTDGLVRSEYWNNKEEVLAVLSGAYKRFTQLDEELFVHGEVRADMIDAGSGLQGAQRRMMESNIKSDNDYSKWDKFYEVINLCNHIVELAPGVQEIDNTFSDYLLQQYISEAIFLRSLSYFYLVRIFNDVPFVLLPSETDNTNFFPPLTAADDILDEITASLIDISKKIPNKYPTIEQSKCRATTGAVNALLADISLWRFNYEDCITYVTEVEESGNYFLLPATEWFENYQPGFSLEGIFEIYFDKPSGQGNRLYNRTIQRNYYVASEYAEEILDVEVFGAAEQIRGYGSISKSGQIWKYGGEYPDQTTVRPSFNNTGANLIIYRLADLYLMKAEALSQLGRFDEALEYINMIRLRANVDPLSISNDKVAFEEVILEERAKELAFEGKRWFDLLRMGRRNNFENKAKLIEILVQNVPSTQKLVQASKLNNHLGWYMPINIVEIERNVNITQNPYYYE